MLTDSKSENVKGLRKDIQESIAISGKDTVCLLQEFF